jgi:FkbM family methyltransferase
MAATPTRTRTVAIAGQVVRFAVGTRREEERLATAAAHEGRMLARLLDAVGDGDCFYDVGANIGTVVLPVASAARGPCLAFEAEPANAARLRENVGLNGLRNVTVLELAAWSSRRAVELRVEGPVGTGTHRVIPGGEIGSTPVPAMTIDEIVSGAHPPPDVIKVDVEGGELEVLRGAAATLRSGAVRDLFVEVHPPALTAQSAGDGALVSMLEELGFAQVWEAPRWDETHRHFRARAGRTRG